MQLKTTIIYAFRDRDLDRVLLSLQSLKLQEEQNFNVIFVDYGSDLLTANNTKNLVESFQFATYYYIAHPGLLWNKSKALNFAIKKTSTEYIFVADVDIVFHPKASALFDNIASYNKAFLFRLCYISKEASKNINKDSISFTKIPIKHCGDINGMILVNKTHLENIYGFDEFFHFYGAEDVDLFQRLKNAGVEIINREEMYFKHIWHQIYNSYDDSKLSETPRLFNIKRINQQHFLLHKKQEALTPINQYKWGHIIESKERFDLSNPMLFFKIDAIHEVIVHFFEFELPNYKNQVVCITITKKGKESIKSFLKKKLKKQVKNYITMKAVNDIILSRIIYTYLHFNYSYKVTSDFNSIEFIIKL